MQQELKLDISQNFPMRNVIFDNIKRPPGMGYRSTWLRGGVGSKVHPAPEEGVTGRLPPALQDWKNHVHFQSL
jgi:hypothetical protein